MNQLGVKDGNCQLSQSVTAAMRFWPSNVQRPQLRG